MKTNFRIRHRSRKSPTRLPQIFRSCDNPPRASARIPCMKIIATAFLLAALVALFAGCGDSAPPKEKKGPTPMPDRVEIATFSGGCFWGVQELIREVPGVVTTQVGYTGGHLDNPHYDDTHDSASGHAEAVQVTFDPAKLSYEKLLNLFFKLHDPTTPNRQGNDKGTQYRSAIFYHSEEQRLTAEKVKAEVDKSGKWKKPVVTEIVPAAKWWPAEEYHQDYLQKHPGGYTCHYWRD
ncbi:MAG: peptide-methionine (S)-S-oxide reductase MsrA [Planctomycetes bacterium]|nr:peptide-methionine (S)-S-oxide reductase MsrA [Planctomycetota bacterium]